MILESFPFRIGIGLLVWVGSYFPMRRMTGEIGTRHPRVLAFGLSAPLALLAVLAWQADPWYRYSVLTLCLTFIATYVAVIGLEKGRQLAE